MGLERASALAALLLALFTVAAHAQRQSLRGTSGFLWVSNSQQRQSPSPPQQPPSSSQPQRQLQAQSRQQQPPPQQQQPQLTPVPPVPYTGFIRVSNGTFVDAACKEFFFNGWNAWRMLDAAAGRWTPPGYSGGRDYVRDLFRRAKALHLNVMRFFTTGDDDYATVLMNSPGNFNEDLFRGLDFILDEAAKASIKLLLVPLNLWKRNNGVKQFEEWCGTASDNTIPRPDIDPRGGTLKPNDRLQTPYAWYQSKSCRNMYKDYLSALANRRNHINGMLYKDDPAIMAWQLMNEPRCQYCGPQAINSWIEEISQHLKRIAPNHLVTTGEEGFFDLSDPMSSYNPSEGDKAKWDSYTGQDFRTNHASPYIDFAVAHMWPESWGRQDILFGQRWIMAHMQVAQELGKPLVLEEFGRSAREWEIPSVRDPWFRLVYKLAGDSLTGGGPLRGALLWEWDGYGKETRNEPGFSIREGDSTFKNHIEPFSHRIASRAAELQAAGGGYVEGCVAVPFRGDSTAAPRPPAN